MKETENDEDDENYGDGDLEEELDEDGNLEEKLKKYQEETEGGSAELLGNENADLEEELRKQQKKGWVWSF